MKGFSRAAICLVTLIVACATSSVHAGLRDKLMRKGKGRANEQDRQEGVSRTNSLFSTSSDRRHGFPEDKKTNVTQEELPPGYDEATSSSAGPSGMPLDQIWLKDPGATDNEANERVRAIAIQALFNKYRAEAQTRSAVQKIIGPMKKFAVDVVIDDTASMMLDDGHVTGTRWGTLTKLMAQMFHFLNEAKGDTMRIHPLSKIVVEDLKFIPGVTTHLSPSRGEVEPTMVDVLSKRPEEWVTHIAAALDAVRDAIEVEGVSTPRLIYMFVDGADSNDERGLQYLISVVRDLRALSIRWNMHIGLQIVRIGNEDAIDEFYNQIDTGYDGDKFLVDYVHGSSVMRNGKVDPEAVYKLVMGPVTKLADRLHEGRA